MDEFSRSAKYEYRANSNLVLEADRKGGRKSEPSGEATSLWGTSIKMGDRVAAGRPAEVAARKEAEAADAKAAADAAAAALPPPLPTGWERYTDKLGRVYYSNGTSVQWERPAAAESRGWEAVVDDAGRTFYHHRALGATQWEMPAELLPVAWKRLRVEARHAAVQRHLAHGKVTPARLELAAEARAAAGAAAESERRAEAQG